MRGGYPSEDENQRLGAALIRVWNGSKAGAFEVVLKRGGSLVLTAVIVYVGANFISAIVDTSSTLGLYSACFGLLGLFLAIIYLFTRINAADAREKIEMRLSEVKQIAGVSRLPADLFSDTRLKLMWRSLGLPTNTNPFKSYNLPESPHDIGELLSASISSWLESKSWRKTGFFRDRSAQYCLAVCPICASAISLTVFEKPMPSTSEFTHSKCGSKLFLADVVVIPSSFGLSWS
jgi:hypothetical protein